MTITVETGPDTSARELPAGAVEPGLDRPVRLIGGRLWLGAAALLLAVGAGTAWGIAGSLPHTLTLHGVVAHGTAPEVARASAPGSVVSVLVTPGTRVSQGQALAVLSGGPGGSTELVAPAAGTVTAVLTAPGGTLVPGTGVVALDPADAPTTVRLFVSSAGQLARLRLGQQVVIPLQEGTARLRITGVDAYPARADTLGGTLPVPVPGVPSGATPVWTVYAEPDAPDSALDAAAAPTAVDASVDLGARHPYQVLFGSTGAGR
ncbi:acetyl-CoA carboxylase biotin carboxyl carrier protein subunit [Streptomyces sp. NBC_01476]|uniref:acetyl-CoA carboxylase biotin carboxyl carrier protein subunit n=1 Tax=Streptomyces sp. NBC_01476 TaxID=2903881 RepID=UPI002E3244F6|nr:acetyl-CoA carboxylase biotin carboxyl carrier protein subunit [Streptomyces sp. NBC_01476]